MTMSATATATAEQLPANEAPNGEAKTTTIAKLKQQQDQQSQDAQLPEVAAGFNSTRAFALLCRAAKALADSTMVPTIYQGNLPNSIIALEMAQRIGASPLMVMQNLYIVYNRPAWSAKFLIACFNQCGRFSAVRYIWSGKRGQDDWGCQAWAFEKATGEKIFGPVITLALAKAEGWYGRKDSKWQTMPEKMFMYRSAAWMIDTHAPELSMGIRTDDEVHDTFDATAGADGKFTVTTESLRQVERQTTGEVPAPSTPPPANAAEWSKSLMAQAAQPELDAAWSACQKAFGGTPPDACLVAWENRKEQLAEASGKQLDL
jgi:hypothetical protein